MSLTSYRAAPPRVEGFGRFRLRFRGAVREERARPCRSGAASREGIRIAGSGQGPPGGRRSKRKVFEAFCVGVGALRGFSVLGRPGGDLLSRVLRQSTIGAKAFDGRVRDGIGSLSPCKGHQAGEERFSPRGEGQAPKARAPRRSRTGGASAFSGKLAFFSKLVFGFRSGRMVSHGFAHPGDKSNQVERAISTGQLHALLRFHTRPIDVVVFHGSSGRTGFEAGFPLRCLQRLSIPHIATLHHRWRDDRSTRDVFTPVLSY